MAMIRVTMRCLNTKILEFINTVDNTAPKGDDLKMARQAEADPWNAQEAEEEHAREHDERREERLGGADEATHRVQAEEQRVRQHLGAREKRR